MKKGIKLPYRKKKKSKRRTKVTVLKQLPKWHASMKAKMDLQTRFSFLSLLSLHFSYTKQ